MTSGNDGDALTSVAGPAQPNAGAPANSAGAPANSAARSPRVVLLGRQGSGKGTQAGRLSERFGVPHVSTGDAFRAAVRSGSPLGATVKNYMDRGELVPDDIVSDVVRAHVFGPGAPEGFLLDGFPRTVVQAEALEAMAGERGLDLVINLDAPISEVLGRLAGRRICRGCGANYNVVDNPPQVEGKCDACGGELYQRDDDTEEVIRRRLEVYETATAPLIAWYQTKGLLATVDAVGTPDEVAARVVATVEQAVARRLSLVDCRSVDGRLPGGAR